MTGTAMQGRPVIAFGGLLAGWIVVRAVMLTAGGYTPQGVEASLPKRAPEYPALIRQRSVPRVAKAEAAFAPPPFHARAAAPANPPSVLKVQQVSPVPPALSVGHLAMWMAAFAQLPSRDGALVIPARPDGSLPSTNVPPPIEPPRAASARHWSGDGWLMWRADSGGALGAAQAGPAYGASQAGAVLRYRLAPGDGHRAAAYLRVTSALRAPHEREVAAGLSARPLARVPISLAGELRLRETPSGQQLRPAITVVSELPPVALPARFTLETYGQAGWVGGSDKTAFVDGLARIGRVVARVGKGDVRLGAGAWGGAQKGAARLDVGPAANLALPLAGGASARLGVDWRWRVAGKARPPSGPALTLSAGF